MINVFHLEAPIIGQCNMKCFQCNYKADSPPFMDYMIPQYTRDLDTLKDKGVLVQRLAIIGGEPLLRKRVRDYARVSRAIRIASQVVLVTNGILLSETDIEEFAAFDIIAICLYPHTPNREEILEYAKGLRSKDQRFWIEEKTEFFYAWRSPSIIGFYEGLGGKEDGLRKWDSCSRSCPVVKNGVLYPCSRAVRVYETLAAQVQSPIWRTVSIEDFGLVIESASSKDIESFFLGKMKFPKACKICADYKTFKIADMNGGSS